MAQGIASWLFKVAFVILIVALTQSYVSRLKPHPASSHNSKLQDTPVFKILQGVTNSAARTPLNASTTFSITHDSCQFNWQQLEAVLSAATAFKAAHGTPGAPLSGQHARKVALDLRTQLAALWATALEPFKADYSTGHLNHNSSRCKSVGLVPYSHSSTQNAAKTGSSSSSSSPRSSAQQRPSSSRTALLLVLGDWSSLERMLRLYSLNLVTIWCYAAMHGYGLELYVHGQPLPFDMPVYFIKVLGVRHLFNQLGYQHVLYLDFDTFTSPHSAPPLSMFYGEFPAASLLLQAEHNVCAAALLWRNTHDAALLLDAWWGVGAAGCCPTFPHDQTALKHMVLVYLANVTQQHWLYGRSMQKRFKLPPRQHTAGQDVDIIDDYNTLFTTGSMSSSSPAAAAAAGSGPAAPQAVLSTDAMPHKVSTWLNLRPLLHQSRSAVGFVGLDAHYPSTPGGTYSRVVLHNCVGMWWGCVPLNTPALLYHTGHWVMEDLREEWLAERLLHSIRDWSNTMDLDSYLRPPHSMDEG